MPYDTTKGQSCSISDFCVGDVGEIKGREFIVTERLPEDRASGSTHVLWKDTGVGEVFLWDWSDPQAKYLRRGHIKIDFGG